MCLCVCVFMCIIFERYKASQYVIHEFAKNNYVKTVADRIESEKEGKLVLLSGKTDTKDKLTDPLLKSDVINSMSLHRRVEMYQWVQDKHKQTRRNGKNNEIYYTYSYEKNGLLIIIIQLILIKIIKI